MEDSNNAIDATTGETNAETNSAAALKQFLLDINLQKYTEALFEAGYEDFECFDLKYTPIEEILKELVEEVKMKKPLARKLLGKLRERVSLNNNNNGLNAPSVHPDDEDEDDRDSTTGTPTVTAAEANWARVAIGTITASKALAATAETAITCAGAKAADAKKEGETKNVS